MGNGVEVPREYIIAQHNPPDFSGQIWMGVGFIALSCHHHHCYHHFCCCHCLHWRWHDDCGLWARHKSVIDHMITIWMYVEDGYCIDELFDLTSIGGLASPNASSWWHTRPGSYQHQNVLIRDDMTIVTYGWDISQLLIKWLWLECRMEHIYRTC